MDVNALSFSVSAKNHTYLTWNRSGGWNGIYIRMRVFRQHGKWSVQVLICRLSVLFTLICELNSLWVALNLLIHIVTLPLPTTGVIFHCWVRLLHIHSKVPTYSSGFSSLRIQSMLFCCDSNLLEFSIWKFYLTRKKGKKGRKNVRDKKSQMIILISHHRS